MLRFVLTILLVSSAALAQDDPVRTALVGWGCEPLQVLALDDRWYAACGTHGVFVVERREGNLVLAEQRRVPGSARALYTRDGLVWVESSHVEARPMIDLAIATPEARAVAAPPSLPPPILHQIPPRSESKLFPSRMGGYFVLEGSVRPLLPIDTRAFALMGEASLGYVGGRHWFAEVRGFPLGGMFGEGRDTPLLGAIAQAGYDHPFFAIGAGGGALTRGAWHEGYDPTSQRYVTRAEQNTRAAIAQFARLGPRDGLNLSALSVFVLVDDWKFGFIEVRGQVPIVRGTWLTPAGAGGAEAGFFYAELGLRKQIYGDRGGGSLFVRPSVGAAGVDKRDSWSSMRAGPMIGIHVEWRK
jgi:hypothetical protein